MSGADGTAYEVKDLVWRLNADFALDVPTLAIPAGKTTAILGRSASGKSTLLSLLGRVEGNYFGRAEDLTGEIWLRTDGDAPVELLALTERELIKRRLRGPVLGFVFQREGLFPGRSVIENVSWALQACGAGAKEAEAKALETLDLVSLPTTRNVATLSGGERKRLALARALAFDPAVLLLDEPLTGLDPEALEKLQDVMAAVAEHPERTIVIVTHQERDVARLAEHVVFMDGGRVAAAGSRAEVAPALEGFFQGKMVDAARGERAAPARED